MNKQKLILDSIHTLKTDASDRIVGSVKEYVEPIKNALPGFELAGHGQNAFARTFQLPEGFIGIPKFKGYVQIDFKGHCIVHIYDGDSEYGFSKKFDVSKVSEFVFGMKEILSELKGITTEEKLIERGWTKS